MQLIAVEVLCPECGGVVKVDVSQAVPVEHCSSKFVVDVVKSEVFMGVLDHWQAPFYGPNFEDRPDLKTRVKLISSAEAEDDEEYDPIAWIVDPEAAVQAIYERYRGVCVCPDDRLGLMLSEACEREIFLLEWGCSVCDHVPLTCAYCLAEIFPDWNVHVPRAALARHKACCAACLPVRPRCACGVLAATEGAVCASCGGVRALDEIQKCADTDTIANVLPEGA